MFKNLCVLSAFFCSSLAFADVAALAQILTGGAETYRLQLKQYHEVLGPRGAEALEAGRRAALEQLRVLTCETRTTRLAVGAADPMIFNAWEDISLANPERPSAHLVVEGLLGPSVEERRHAYWAIIFHGPLYAPIKEVLFTAIRFQWLAGLRNQFIANFLTLEAGNWPPSFVNFLTASYRDGDANERRSIHALLATAGMINSSAGRAILGD